MKVTGDQKIAAKKFKDKIDMTQNNKPVIIQPNSEPCYDFTVDGVQRLKKTVIISPIMIEEYENNKFKLTYGCSRGNFCKDAECQYVKHLEREEEPVSDVETFSFHPDY